MRATRQYKAEKPNGFPQADLYQLFAYCTVLGLPVGHLVYAKGNEDAREHVVRNSGVAIIAHTLDLEAQPEGLLESVRALAQGMMRPVVAIIEAKPSRRPGQPIVAGGEASEQLVDMAN